MREELIEDLIARLRDENVQLRKFRDEAQRRNTELVLENRRLRAAAEARDSVEPNTAGSDVAGESPDSPDHFGLDRPRGGSD